MEKWFIKNKNINYSKIAKDLNISEIISKILVNRDIYDYDQIDRFLHPNIDKLYNPILMHDLEKGAKIIRNTIDNGGKIRIVGDFDVDGVMSVYILYNSFKALGANVDYKIPDRILDGYGINNEIVHEAKHDGVSLIITCDNGIAALEQIRLAKELGMNIIITDHHDLPYVEEDGNKRYLVPEADAVINPKNPNCNYPFKYLCGAGVAFKLIHYLYKSYNRESECLKYLEFVAIATVCDVVNLVDENRIMVKYGLNLINNTNNIGLKALIEVAEAKLPIASYHLGFIIGPTINASGRLESAYKALELFLCSDMSEALTIAKYLRDVNDERKALTMAGYESVVTQIENSSLKEYKVLLVYEPDIHESVAGIIAGRVKDSYNKPTIVLTDGQGGVKGSARSIEEYNIFEELSKCKDLLNRFGGHPMAAGLSLDRDNIDILRDRLNNLSNLTEDAFVKKIFIDMALPIEYINYKLIEDINSLEPFGMGNSKPLFGDKGLKIRKMFKFGNNNNVIKLVLESKSGPVYDGMIFYDDGTFEQLIIERYGEDDLTNVLNGKNNNISLDIIYYPSVNEYMGRTSIQLVIKGYRI
ncbi:MAG: single-stranded-DNA-specific exonuclease RecJ [Tissierellaceae bacterium]|nr:single-stranded-DNA-specific exonuclease RecJ [Tissierellaceae bacterium]